MHHSLKIVSLLFLLFLMACLPESEQEELMPFEGIYGYIDYSMYENQIFYNLTNSEIVSVNANAMWDIGFKSSGSHSYVILNYAKHIAAINLGAVDFNDAITIPDEPEWIYDASSGNTDSLAIMNWVDSTTNPYTYSNNVYIIGQKDGSNYSPQKKLRLIQVDESSYNIEIAEVASSDSEILTIDKNPNKNYITYQITGDVTPVDIYPDVDNWDLLFTSYNTILFTDDGIATPYMVRGVYINPEKVTVAKEFVTSEIVPESENVDLDLMKHFMESGIDDTTNLMFSATQDAVGYNWKDVEILGGSSANYVTNKRMFYYVKDNNHNYFKLRFLAFYNSGGQKGYPTFEYLMYPN